MLVIVLLMQPLPAAPRCFKFGGNKHQEAAVCRDDSAQEAAAAAAPERATLPSYVRCSAPGRKLFWINCNSHGHCKLWHTARCHTRYIIFYRCLWRLLWLFSVFCASIPWMTESSPTSNTPVCLRKCNFKSSFYKYCCMFKQQYNLSKIEHCSKTWGKWNF